MSLIVVKAPKPLWKGRHAAGMNVSVNDLTPGTPPPWIQPLCRVCGIMVERFTVDWISSPHHLAVQVQCHGKTSGFRLTREEVLHKAKAGGEGIWVFGAEKVTTSGR